MESWRQVWRDGFAKVLPLDGLVSLRDALLTDDRRLVQGHTTTPPPLMCVQGWRCEECDPVGWTLFKGEGATVGQVVQHFGAMCDAVDTLLGHASCRWFLNFWDDTPRAEAFAELLGEVALTLAERGVAAAERELCEQIGL